MSNISTLKAIAIVAVAGSLLSFAPKPKHKTAPAPKKKTETGIGEEDDADARYQYELMMLRDPATGKIPANIREKELAFAKTLPHEEGVSFFYDKGAAERTTSVMDWQPRGPWNVGGRTRAMAVDVTNENVIVAGSCSGGMWRSTDGGNTWATTTPTNQYQSVACLAQDTRAGHANVWYFGTGEAYGASASATGAFYLGNGTFKSTDSGKTWTLLPTTAGGITSFGNWSQVS